MTEQSTVSVGAYIGLRLRELGLAGYFAIPGDYNLALLDEMIRVKEVEQLYCCSELNAGYAADGYARAAGFAAVVVTYSVGGLSAINAVAGAYAEDLPVIAISGAPNSNSVCKNRLLHHTLGKVDYEYVRDMFARVTVEAVTVDHVDDAARKIDRALGMALATNKPVYIEVACNLAAAQIQAPLGPLQVPKIASSPQALEAAVDHAASLLNGAAKPVAVAGPQIRSWKAADRLQRLVDVSGYALASMPSAKGFMDETQDQHIGIYWGSVSSPGCGEIVESCDAYLFVGPLFTDYTTVGYNLLLKPKGLIVVGPDSVKVADRVYDQVTMVDFLDALAAKLSRNDASLVAYKRIEGEAPPVLAPADDAPIPTRFLFNVIEGMLDEKTSIVAETGDSWFNGMRLHLPKGCGFEIQMQYGSIGWSVGATLGYQAAVAGDRRVIALIGDGSFQMTAQEVSTMVRYGLKPIIFLFNNGAYTIEVEIHDGPYNVINNWNYARLIEVFNNEGKAQCMARQVHTVGELRAAVTAAQAFDGLCFLEVFINRDDCNKNLLKWGSYVATANSEPPMIP